LIIVVDQLQRVGNRAPSNDRIAGLGDIGDRERMPASTTPTYIQEPAFGSRDSFGCRIPGLDPPGSHVAEQRSREIMDISHLSVALHAAKHSSNEPERAPAFDICLKTVEAG
jgi:hypothetical protein